MTQKTLNRSEFRIYKNKDYDEVFSFFKKFIDSVDLLYLKSNPKQLSKREKIKKIKDSFEHAVANRLQKYVLIDSDTGDIVAFYSFHPPSKMVEWIFANPDYYFSVRVLNSAMEFFKKMSQKYYLDSIYTRLLKRRNFKRYVIFVCKHHNGKVIYEAEDYAAIEFKM